MSNSSVILNVDSIVKNFSKVTAVNNLCFSINKGEVFVILGPNGAGKTTTVRMIMDIIKPDSGKITFNLPGDRNEFIKKSSKPGYLPEERGLYQEIPIINTLVFIGIIRGMKKKEAEKAADEWLKKLELFDRRKNKLSALSKGNQQKIQFISAVIHNPSFVILDEPFSGFDPINQEIFLSIIKAMAADGTTVLLSAHQMQLVERIADRVLLLNNGKNIAYGTVNEIRQGHSSGEILVMKVDEKTDFSLLQNSDAAERIEILNEYEIKIYLKTNRSISGFLNLASSNYQINSVRTEHISLHDIFIEKVKKDTGESDEK